MISNRNKARQPRRGNGGLRGEACEKFPDDPHMKKCAEECRECEKACREMVKHVGHSGGK
ncbi:MAG: four-helix bundle copper-binding protein [Pirellulales bacterium]